MAQLTTYLQLNDRLSQIWINKYTLVLLLAMVKLFFFSRSIQNAMLSSQNYIISNCETIDSIYSKVTDNTPHYLGIMGNYLLDKTMEETIKATLKTLSLLVYASEELLTFVIDLYLGTYACLAVSAIDGTVDVATNTTEKLIGVVNSTVVTLANDLDDGLDDISKFINKIIEAASKVENFFTGDDDEDNSSDGSDDIKKVNLTISAIRDLKIPSSINDKLEELSAKTPDFAEVKNKTKSLVSIPFEQVRKEIKSVNATEIMANKSMLYVPPIVNDNGLPNGICSSNKPEIENFYKVLLHSLKITTIVLIVLMIVAAVVVLVPIAWNEYRLWSRLTNMKQQYLSKCFNNSLNSDIYMSTTLEEDEEDDDDISSNRMKLKENPFLDDDKQTDKNLEDYDVIASYQHCFNNWNSKISFMVTKLLNVGTKNQIRSKTDQIKTEWIVAYITSERALCVLGIGLLALLVCIFQFIMIAILRKELNVSSGSMINNEKSSSLTNSSSVDTMKNDMNIWTTQTNDYINYTETTINKEMFGWIVTTTESINSTVVTMIDDIDSTLADIFNGTLLYSPMKTVVGCVIENKLYTVEKAMTWIHEKAELSLPRINGTELYRELQNTQYQNGTSNSTALTTSSKMVTIVDELKDDMQTGLLAILDAYHKMAIQELIVALSILAVWLIQIPVAFLIWHLKRINFT
ncbi:pheromone-regulated protein PRM1 NDAI_0F04290 [Naumovozyma dairenensis CBS 421]|uniref:Plasma membrane fusion protein PRM1 n=1 Tax=Naumovozyma dairenensis (strain ATCC 10597 / BCRC 20456 / CBS 421 / NBRC 0211 / NRRL Y-12639) TaxID=1071378 RepID=G0WD86_NAUDC|nr:hypothetical protein NDAI_0F04290 [Naumovozyma dairenensis CBS 421]CCD25747.1 hypothetical protein NDAI_0F04290 [Naumovozyma dairenensis CBS 421]